MKLRTVMALVLLAGLSISSVALAADNDGDGLQDEWELAYFVNLQEEDAGGDPDGDGLTNQEEEIAGTDPTREDTDGDELTDAQELASPYALDPTNMDTDGDFLTDGEEIFLGTDPTLPDTDGDGLTDYIENLKNYNPNDPDTDHGGIQDGEEILVDKTDPTDPADDFLDSDNDGVTNYNEALLGTNPFLPDSDQDWLLDGQEDADQDGVWEPDEGESNPSGLDQDQDGVADGYDTDGDGLADGWEVLIYKTDPLVMDTDGDGLLDGEEHDLKAEPSFECIDPLLTDTDGDGLDDGQEVGAGSPSLPCEPDSDFAGVLDIAELHEGTDPMDPTDEPLDTDGDGLSNLYEIEVSGTDPVQADTDADGLTDAEEHLPLVDLMVTDPNDADTDDDGLLDGSEGGMMIQGVLKFGSNPLDPDTDNDGLNDGLEKGLSLPEPSANDPDATDMQVFQADSDPASTTYLRDADTDNDGLLDGEEDANHNGQVDPGETNPLIFDTDGDDMGDGWESKYATEDACTEAPMGPLDPLDAGDKNLDNDQDGLTNFEEYSLIKISEGQIVQNQTNPCDPDSDDDGLKDGKEEASNYGVWGPVGLGTDPNDADTDDDKVIDGIEDANLSGTWTPLVETNPLQPDTDGDNLLDGSEDVNGNGIVDEGETDPLDPDTDDDGLSDGEEANLLGTDPLNPDTDGDGLEDGLEVGKPGDHDPSTKTNPHLPDTDGDGLTDGEEDANGDGEWDADEGETDPLNPDSDGDKLTDALETGFGDDEDPSTTTDPLSKDSDQDGLWDSHEDQDKDGAVDENETDPNKEDTDEGGVGDGVEVLEDFSDPLNPLDDRTADPDGDGLINGQEWELGTDPYDADSDGDTIPDPVEVGPDLENPLNTDGDSQIDAIDPDSDNDGIPDAEEAGDADPETAPVDSDGDETPDYQDLDSDADQIPDATEYKGDANNDGVPDPDADGDLTPNHLDDDSDADGKSDLEEGTGDQDNDLIPNYLDPDDEDGPEVDSDGDGLTNQEELDLGTNPFNPDTDEDGLNDKQEVDGGADPLDQDTDDDGLEDGADGLDDSDGDGLANVFDPDSDDDGVLDGTEAGAGEPLAPFSDSIDWEGEEIVYEIAGTDVERGHYEPDLDPTTVTDHEQADTDGDGADDGAEDPDHNGRVDFEESGPADEADTLEVVDLDDDGLTATEELLAGLDDGDGDRDDDGLPDGAEHNWRLDTDGDGLANVRDPDSDNDGLPDGLEEGVTEPTAGTLLLVGNFRPDQDPETETWMLLPDSDGGGLVDGLEDVNLDGRKDEGETDPLDGTDDDVPTYEDADGDGLPDAQETALGLDPADADSDDDGLPDGAELNYSTDLEPDGLLCGLDPDSDDDGLTDGTEAGMDQPVEAGADVLGTDESVGNFRPDQDPLTTTSMAAFDTDGGGISDGGEDTNKNGALDDGETDPAAASDDSAICTDTDGDGLCDAEELLFSLDPLDADRDDDGVADGEEHNWNLDTDGDGVINALDPDSDGDDLYDGTERGASEPIPIATDPNSGEVVLGTDPASPNWIPDGDPESTTWMLVRDTDGGGVSDGLEDLDLDGTIDDGETDPTDPSDDGDVNPDMDGDGIPNEVEKDIGTDPFDPDSDDDTISDGEEVGDEQSAPVDTDEDGTIDALDTDSDDDGLSDAVEAGDEDLDTPAVDTDEDDIPDYRDADSDDDGLSDEDEAALWHTDPTKVDTDGGGADDWLETQTHKSDPLNPEDDWMGWFEEGAQIRGGGGCSTSGRGALPSALLLILPALLLLGLRLRRWCVLALLVFLLVPAGARADFHPDATKTAIFGNVIHPTFDGSGIYSVNGLDIAEHLELRGTAWFQYMSNPLGIYRDGERLRALVGTRSEFGVGAAMGFFRIGEAGFRLPFVVYQTGQYPGMKLGDVPTTGMMDPEIFLKARLLDPEHIGLGIGVVSGLTLPIGDAGADMGLDGFSWRNDLILSHPMGSLTWLLNVGYLMQPRSDVFTIVDDDKYLLSMGMLWSPGDVGPRAGAELVTWLGAARPFENLEEAGAEVIGTAGWRFDKLVVSGGAGAGLLPGYAVPGWRAFLSVTWRQRKDPDRDGDGILNEVDKCPDEAEDVDGFQDEDGCPDKDNDQDGIPDKKDKCPDKAEDKDYFEDEDGCPEDDNDQDGIPDQEDKCPKEPEDKDGFQDEDGCPDPDNDNDGIPDVKDKCPLKKEVFNDFEDEDGCPDKKLAQLEEKTQEIKILEKVHFKFMSAELLPDSFPLLDQVKTLLDQNPRILLVEIGGHTDRTGPRKLNLALSRDRARSVREYLVKKGIDPKRLKAIGYGNSRLIDFRRGPEANFNNRRVEFKILKTKAPSIKKDEKEPEKAPPKD